MLPAVLAAAALPGIWNALSIVVALNNQGNEKKQSVNVVPMTLKINSAWKKSKDGKHNIFFLISGSTLMREITPGEA